MHAIVLLVPSSSFARTLPNLRPASTKHLPFGFDHTVGRFFPEPSDATELVTREATGDGGALSAVTPTSWSTDATSERVAATTEFSKGGAGVGVTAAMSPHCCIDTAR